MKLTVWQQFSSNHSNAFTIVGQFQNETHAQNAKDKLEATLLMMRSNSLSVEATNALKGQMAQIGLLWEHDIVPDWLKYGTPRVERYTNILFVRNNGDNWSAVTPLDMILQKLGSIELAVEQELYGGEYLWTCDFDIFDTRNAENFEKFIMKILTVDMKIYDELYKLLPNRMTWLVWRSGSGGAGIQWTRAQSHFRLSEAFFYDDIGMVEVLTEFSAWLKECGASNIQYSVRSTP